MNVLDLAQQYGKYFKSGSKRFRGPCPDQGCGGTDRFSIWPDQNDGDGSYYCFQCGRGGDSVQFLMDFNGRSFNEACEIMDKTPGTYIQPKSPITPIPPSKKQDVKKWSPETADDPQDLWCEKSAKFIDECHEALLENNDQMDYLADRGIDPQTVIDAKLGWNEKDRYRPLESWGLPEDKKPDGTLKKLWLPVGLVIPYFVGDKPVRVKIRRPDAERERFLDKLKYYEVQGSSKAPMVLGTCKEAFVVIEAELDGLLVYQDAGDLVSVVSLGSKSRRPDTDTANQLSMALVILDCLDYDGTAVGDTSAWKDNYPQTKRWPVPKGKDPGDAVKMGVDIREWILAGLPPRFHVGKKKKTVEPKIEAKNQKSTLGANPENPEPVADNMENDPDTPISRLASELKNTPLKVINDPLRLAIKSVNKMWPYRNWEKFGIVTDMLFLNADVRDAVRNLPVGEYGFYELENASAAAGIN